MNAPTDSRTANGQAASIGFIGGGNMARAILRGLRSAGHPAARLVVSEPDAAQRSALVAAIPDVSAVNDNRVVAATADVLVLAVKPQVIATVATEIAGGDRRHDQLVLSVAAGVNLKLLAGWLGPATPLVRAMPNQPALIGAGVSVLAAAPSAGADQRELADYVMRSVGKAIWADESTLDAVTAVSGSGPAYFYLLTELIEQAAVDLGLPRELAATLCRETALGAARTLIETDTDPGKLRAAVTSPGGTTAAALAVFERAGLARIVGDAVRAARDRAAALGNAANDGSQAANR